MDDVRRDAEESRMKAAIGKNAFDDFELQKPTKHKTLEGELISEFMEEVNKERPAVSFYIKNGKKVKLKKLNYMGARRVLEAIADDSHELQRFLSECRDYKNRNGSFSKRFFAKPEKKD